MARANFTYEFSKAQQKAVDKFKAKHIEDGGSYTYMFTETGIGVVVQLQHTGSGDIIDISEYQKW